MTKVTFEEKYYPAVKETVYKTQLSNGLTVSLLPKQDFNEVYGIVTVQFVLFRSICFVNFNFCHLLCLELHPNSAKFFFS